jgi:hypothetical protein
MMDGAQAMFDRNAQSRKSAASPTAPSRDLGPRALAIVERLPRAAVPHRTYLKHPLVVTRLLAAWADPHEFRRRIDALLLDARGDRQGFDFLVIREITALREYYDTHVRPVKADAWDSAGRY